MTTVPFNKTRWKGRQHITPLQTVSRVCTRFDRGRPPSTARYGRWRPLRARTCAYSRVHGVFVFVTVTLDILCKNGWTNQDALCGLIRVAQWTMYRMGAWSITPWEGANLGSSGPLKSIGSLRCSLRSKRDHSVFNNGATYDPAFHQNSLTTCLRFLSHVA